MCGKKVLEIEARLNWDLILEYFDWLVWFFGFKLKWNLLFKYNLETYNLYHNLVSIGLQTN